MSERYIRRRQFVAASYQSIDNNITLVNNNNKSILALLHSTPKSTKSNNNSGSNSNEKKRKFDSVTNSDNSTTLTNNSDNSVNINKENRKPNSSGSSDDNNNIKRKLLKSRKSVQNNHSNTNNNVEVSINSDKSDDNDDNASISSLSTKFSRGQKMVWSSKASIIYNKNSSNNSIISTNSITIINRKQKPLARADNYIINGQLNGKSQIENKASEATIGSNIKAFKSIQQMVYNDTIIDTNNSKSLHFSVTNDGVLDFDRKLPRSNKSSSNQSKSNNNNHDSNHDKNHPKMCYESCPLQDCYLKEFHNNTNQCCLQHCDSNVKDNIDQNSKIVIECSSIRTINTKYKPIPIHHSSNNTNTHSITSVAKCDNNSIFISSLNSAFSRIN